MRQAKILYKERLAGRLIQDENGYHFTHDTDYINQSDAQPVSLALPLQQATYTSMLLFPFFDGLIPEGWLLRIIKKNWKLDPRDRMGLLLACCKDCIGAVSVQAIETEDI